MNRRIVVVFSILLLLVISGIPALAQDEFVFGVVLVGPQNDRGWSQAHFEGGKFVEENLENSRMLVFESLNPADAPETTLMDVVTEMVDEGAQLIFTTSDAFEEDTDPVAEAFPDVTFINVSGDNALTGEAPPNVGNVMGQMEWGKEIAGCAAGLATQTGHIGYLGPLINAETRRLASSAFLGARYCWENFRDGDPADLQFDVTWIGFWFNIPGVTLDPTEETNTFFDNGADVVISGIDTTEAIVVAGQRASEGEDIFAVPYDFTGACDEAPEICLGVPFFNWGPAYLDIAQRVIDGTWEQAWEWVGPDWDDLNNLSTTGIGFIFGDGLDEEQSTQLGEFIDLLSEVANSPDTPNTFNAPDAPEGLDIVAPNAFALWEGPLAKQDGTPLAEEGELVPVLDVWYLDQLLEGMNGVSN
ncbi:MAG: BMP family ABC transporter substrate-binding protein [Chloroflexi bacterium]|nr:MAG: BMP family ABC transporter substrate-binding protein [Chloroflexota bacterium]